MWTPSRWIPFSRAHPSHRELLLMQSRELSPRHLARLQRHLTECEQCRRYIESAKDAIEGYGSILEDSFAADSFVAAKSDALQDRFARRLNDRDREMDLSSRAYRPRGWMPRLAWLVVAALSLAAVLFVEFSQPKVAQAAEVVERAVRAGIPAWPQRQSRMIEIRTRRHRVGSRVCEFDAQSNRERSWGRPIHGSGASNHVAEMGRSVERARFPNMARRA